MISARTIYVALGKFGDLCTILPLVWAEHRAGRRPILCVAEKFASLLDGVSYCERLVWKGGYDQQREAIRWLRSIRPRDRIITAQTYGNVDNRRLTPTYHQENWRVAGVLEQFGQHPLVFDRRDKAREQALWHPLMNDKPTILVVRNAGSAPFKKGAELLAAVRAEFGETHNVMDLDAVPVERMYDLLGAMDRAVCLVTVDTFALHLSNASDCPVVAIVGDDKWVHSVPPPQAVAVLNYADAYASFEPVLKAVRRVVDAEGRQRRIVHCSDLHGDSERHAQARATWPAAYGDEPVVTCFPEAYARDAREIGDHRALPLLNDLLAEGLKRCANDDDVVIWTNSDVSLADDSFMVMSRQAALWGAFGIRRTEPGLVQPHPGREVFGFSAGWLRKHLAEMPELYLAAPYFDIVVAAMIRKQRGIVTTMKNLAIDFSPTELPADLCGHEPHASFWATPEAQALPANQHNTTTARAWCAKNAPKLRF